MTQATSPVDVDRKRSPRRQSLTAEGAIKQHLRANKTGPLKRFANVIEGVYCLGGAEAVVKWSIVRIQQQLGSKYELQQLESLLRSIANAERRGQAEIVRQWEEQQRVEEAGFQERQKRNRELLNQRAQERHMIDPRIQLQERLERSLHAASAPEPTSKPKGHSRKAKGEVGARLGKKIDLLLAEIREHEAACESSCCAAPEAVLEKPSEPSTEDPPAPAFGGEAERAPVDSAAVGGDGGFSNPEASTVIVTENVVTLQVNGIELKGSAADIAAVLRLTISAGLNC